MNQGRKKMIYVRGAENCDVSASAAGTRTARGDPGASNLKNFEIQSLSAFWGKNLQNSKGYETPYKNTQIKYLNYLGQD